MSITINTKTYTKDSNPTPDTAVYAGPAETNLVKDRVLLKRTAPKKTKDSNGVARRQVKTAKSVVINGISRDMIAVTEYSYPADALVADVTTLRTDHASTVAHATVMPALVDKGTLEY